MLIHNRQLFGPVNQVQSYEKNVIGGAMLDNVFQHKLIFFAKPYFPKPHKKEREHPHNQCKCPLCQLY